MTFLRVLLTPSLTFVLLAAIVYWLTVAVLGTFPSTTTFLMELGGCFLVTLVAGLPK